MLLQPGDDQARFVQVKRLEMKHTYDASEVSFPKPVGVPDGDSPVLQDTDSAGGQARTCQKPPSSHCRVLARQQKVSSSLKQQTLVHHDSEWHPTVSGTRHPTVNGTRQGSLSRLKNDGVNDSKGGQPEQSHESSRWACLIMKLFGRCCHFGS